MSMSSLTVPQPRVATAHRLGVLARVRDYLELTKPKIGVLVLVTVAVAAFVASWGQPDPWLLAHALVGTWLIAASGSALNQWLESRQDSLMPRTANRPLPAGRLRAGEVVAFASVTVLLGAIYLALLVNITAAAWGLLSWVLYVWVYTPLKTRSSTNTAIGAVAGALPLVIGWTAVGGKLDMRAGAMFLTLFLWQFPHFMAIAWLYRKQYAQAGMKMLPVVDPTGRRAGVQAVLAAAALVPISLLPALALPGANWFFAASAVLGVAQLVLAVAFCFQQCEPTARRLLRASLVYLPAQWLLLALAVVL